MALNETDTNNTLSTVIETITSSLNDLVNTSAKNSDVPIKDLYEDYRINEKYSIFVYRAICYVLAVLIILSNLSVVISSGLILKKGQKPKSTYMLLGNVSLADTIVGLSIIYGLSVETTLNSSPMCVFQTAILVTPAMVSIFSVGFIGIDRYIYILYGLYYKRWFNTTRVRIGIVLIWIISITLSFLPATGWVNHELAHTRCIYVGLYPGALILLNSILSIIPIIGVAVLYTIILSEALKTVKTINNTIKVKDISKTNNGNTIRMNRRTFHDRTPSIQSVTESEKNNNKLKRSASFNLGTGNKIESKYKSKSTDDLHDTNTNNFNNVPKNIDNQSKIQFESDYSISTVETSASLQCSTEDNRIQPNPTNISMKKIAKTRKVREPNKWRAITVVMLTTASFIVTWMPFFITVMFYVFCEEKLTNPKCINLRAMLGGPLAMLAFINSILNPLIYAWWHKGFQRSAKAYYKQYLHKYICRVVR